MTVPVLRFVVPGPPVPKARARAGMRGHYTPEPTRAYEQLVKMYALAAWTKSSGWRKDWGSYSLDVTIVRAKKTGDADNFLKSVSDSLNGIVWLDDAAVTELQVRVRDVGDPCAIVEVRMLGELDLVEARAERQRDLRAKDAANRSRRRA